jgi:hypothetical protein
MIGTIFAKPLQPDTLTRSVKKKVEREAERVEAVPVQREVTRTVLEPVYGAGEGGARVALRYEERRVTELVTELRWRTVKAMVTDEVDVPETVENPAPNTLGRYREAAEWADAHGAALLEREPNALFPQGYYEVCALPQPSEEEKAAAELARARAERADAVAALTVTVDGMTFDGDEAAQTRMARAVLMADSPDELTEWVLADSSVAQVSAAQLRRACKAAGQAQTKLWTVPYTR